LCEVWWSTIPHSVGPYNDTDDYYDAGAHFDKLDEFFEITTDPTQMFEKKWDLRLKSAS